MGEFARLPGVGRKSAERLANYIVSVKPQDALPLAEAIREVKRTVKRCQQCFNLTDQEFCRICLDTRRDRQVVCVVEQPNDITSLEAAGVYEGTYHVLGGRIAPLEGIHPNDLTIDALVARIDGDQVRELIMATNPTLEGDGTSLYITNLLDGRSIKITRLARGIATGSVLEFANREMLADALRGRQSF